MVFFCVFFFIFLFFCLMSVLFLFLPFCFFFFFVISLSEHATVSGCVCGGFRLHLASTSCPPGRSHGLCDRSCHKRSKSCRLPPYSCAQCDPSYYSCNSFALRNVPSRCCSPGSYERCDQFCCSCNSSSRVPGYHVRTVGQKKK